jgi:quercetin dioxygenase-like cupin family protein
MTDVAGHEHGRFADLAHEEVYPGVVRRSFSSDKATVTSYEFAPGATFPQHRHPAEQVTLVQEGEVLFTVDGEQERMGPGTWSVVAGGVEHGITAGEQGARFVAIVSPRRERSDEYEVSAS